MSSAAPEVLAHGGVGLTTVSGIGIWVWARAPTHAEVARAHATMCKLAAEAGDTGALVIVEPGVGPPAGEARELLTRLPADARLRLSAIVPEGDGTQAMFARTIVRGIQLLKRGTVRREVFARAEDAVRWLARAAPSCGVAMPSEARLAEALEAVRDAARRSR